MSAASTLICPGCNKTLRVPAQFAGKAIRCKSCGRSLPPPASVASPKPSPAAKASAPPAKPQVRKAVRWPRVVMPLVLAFVFIGGVAGIFWWLREDLSAAIEQRESSRPASTAAVASSTQGSLLALANPTAGVQSDPAKPTKPKPIPTKPRSNYRGRIPQPFAGRALLVGVKNYLFLNPLNPGYSEGGRNRDLLGLGTLARLLVEEHGFAYDQVAELSDVASSNNPFPPTKSVLEANLDAFLAGARPHDHVVLVFVGYATAKEDQAFLVPLDGDPSRPETLLPVKGILEKLGRCPGHSKLFILESSPIDPDQPEVRPAPPPLTEKAAAVFRNPPKGVQVWLSHSPGQASRQITSGGYVGSVFLHHLVKRADLKQNENWQLIKDKPGVAEGTVLALPLLAPVVAAATGKSVQDQRKENQQPVLFGVPGARPEGAAAKPSPVLLKAPSGADAQMVADILRELPLSANDPARELRPQWLPPFDAKRLERYRPDYRTDFKSISDLKSRFQDKPLRLLTVDAALQLDQRDFKLRMKYRHNPNDQQFKRQLESEQMKPASLAADLTDLHEQMKAMEEQRAAEKSPRWQAHFDYVQARVLAKLIWVSEYNFCLGNNLRKDSPTLKEPSRNNGWALVPQEKLQQAETRALEKERKRLLDRLIAEHAGTPWELLARRELVTPLGLTLKEARVEP